MSTDPLFAEELSVVLAVRITLPFISIEPPAEFESLIVLPRLIPSAPVIVTDSMKSLAPTLPLRVTSPEDSPLFNTRVSSPSVPTIVPSKVISPPPLAKVMSPVILTFPRKCISPAVSKLPVEPENSRVFAPPNVIAPTS